MTYNRIDNHGRVISRNGSFITVHTADQCDYEGCNAYRASCSRHCARHTR